MNWWAWLLVAVYILVVLPGTVVFCKAAGAAQRPPNDRERLRGAVASAPVRAHREPRP